GYPHPEDPGDATYRVLDSYRLRGKRIANQDDAWFFSVARYRKLLARLGVDSLPDGSGIVERVSRVKATSAIEDIRPAGRYCEVSMRAAVSTSVAGATDNDVAAAAYQ